MKNNIHCTFHNPTAPSSGILYYLQTAPIYLDAGFCDARHPRSIMEIHEMFFFSQKKIFSGKFYNFSKNRMIHHLFIEAG